MALSVFLGSERGRSGYKTAAYKCRTVLHVKSRADLETDNYSVQLTTLYDSNQELSYISNEVAAAQALRYVRVPSKMVYTLSTTLGKTNKLYILDVKPRSKRDQKAGPLLLTAYGLDKMELTLPEESKLNMLRKRFEERPGRLSNGQRGSARSASAVGSRP